MKRAPHTTEGNPIDRDAAERAGLILHESTTVFGGGRRSGKTSSAATGQTTAVELRATEERATDSDLTLAAWAMQRTVPGWGLWEDETPSARTLRLFFSGLFGQSLMIRADATASAIVGLRSNGFDVERRDADGFASVEASHPWRVLLADPTPDRDAFQVWQMASLIQDISGAAAFVVEDDARGVPYALHLIYPEFGRMVPVPSATGGFAGFVFHRADGRTIDLEARDVVWWTSPDPTSPYRTRSLLQRAALLVEKAEAADTYERDTVKDGRFPPAYITTEKDLSGPQKEKEGREFAKRYIGIGRAGSTVKGVPVFSNGTRLERTPFTPEELALVESGILNDSRLHRVTGVPEALFDKTANVAAGQTARAVFAQYTIQPRVDALASILTSAFTRAFGAPRGVLRVSAPNVVPRNRSQELKDDEVRLRTGTPLNVILRERGEDEVDDGDVSLISAALRPLSSVANPAPPPSFGSNGSSGSGGNGSGGNGSGSGGGSGSPETDADKDADEEDDESERAAQHVRQRSEPARIRRPRPSDFRNDVRVPDHARRAVLSFVGTTRTARVALTDDQLAAEWRAVDDEKREAEDPIEAEALRLFEEQREAIVEAIENASGPIARSSATHTTRGMDDTASLAVAELFDLDVWIERYAAEIGPLVAGAMEAGFATAVLRLGSGFSDLTWDPDDAFARDILSTVVELTKTVPATTFGRLESAIAAGLDEGESYAQIASRIEDLFDEMAPYRARTIAQTAGTAAFEAGQKNAFGRADIASERWLTQRDGDVRPAHDEADGQQIQTGGEFLVGGERLRFPADPAGSPSNTINCRCTSLPVLPDPDEERSSTGAQGEERSSASEEPAAPTPERYGERNDWIRAQYRRRVQSQGGGNGEPRDVVLDDLRTGEVAGEAYALSRRQVRRIVDGY